MSEASEGLDKNRGFRVEGENMRDPYGDEDGNEVTGVEGGSSGDEDGNEVTGVEGGSPGTKDGVGRKDVEEEDDLEESEETSAMGLDVLQRMVEGGKCRGKKVNTNEVVLYRNGDLLLVLDRSVLGKAPTIVEIVRAVAGEVRRIGDVRKLIRILSSGEDPCLRGVIDVVRIVAAVGKKSSRCVEGISPEGRESMIKSQESRRKGPDRRRNPRGVQQIIMNI